MGAGSGAKSVTFMRFLRKLNVRVVHSRDEAAAAYQRHLDSKLELYGGDRDLAFADAVGSASMDLFRTQGDVQVAALLHHGLTDGMTVYDIGCGCGRTAQALQRSGWRGRYIGADIIADFVGELRAKCPGYEAYVHREPTLLAEDASLDLVYHWSVFTHLPPEQCFLYLRDTFRTLKPGGRLVFSFMEFADPRHRGVFDRRVDVLARGRGLNLLDTFLHRDWITTWAAQIGFSEPRFTDGADATFHPSLWQTLATMTRPRDDTAKGSD